MARKSKAVLSAQIDVTGSAGTIGQDIRDIIDSVPHLDDTDALQTDVAQALSDAAAAQASADAAQTAASAAQGDVDALAARLDALEATSDAPLVLPAALLSHTLVTVAGNRSAISLADVGGVDRKGGSNANIFGRGWSTAKVSLLWEITSPSSGSVRMGGGLWFQGVGQYINGAGETDVTIPLDGVPTVTLQKTVLNAAAVTVPGGLFKASVVRRSDHADDDATVTVYVHGLMVEKA